MITDPLTDILDSAVTQWQNNEPLDEIMVRFADQTEALRPLLQLVAALEPLQSVQFPSDEAQVQDRNAFLADISRWQLQAVSPTRLERLKGWITRIRPRQGRYSASGPKEMPLMNSVIVRFAALFVLGLALIAGTVAASASSLPASPLYPVKLVVEDARLALSSDPSHTAALHLELAQERVWEMTQMVSSGDEPGQDIVTRLENHLQNAVVAAARSNR